MILPQLMTRADVSAVLQIGERAVDKLRTTGALPALRLGGRRVRFLKKDVEALLRPHSGVRG
ncbi:MAG TPA: helix-turn-helix domain-containing protein [Roseiarcus sp.]|jgi:excisionase family DNA binding protein|nr:helix-turn-helix domain-containing protein [Roseiarcus sp.]